MGKLLKIGIVGCGAIGSSLARRIKSDFTDSSLLACVYDVDRGKSKKLSAALGNKKLAARDLDSLIGRVDLVIEAASAGVSMDVARKALSRGRDIMIMSVGGIIRGHKELAGLAKRHNSRIFVPSGALCGLDGLKAAMCGKISKVTLTTRKPPAGFRGVPYVLKKKIRLENLKKDTVIFQGNALKAVKHFPQNINVAAVLSIAGLGAGNTKVKIVASPSILRNTHEVEIEGSSGRVFTRTENVIHPDNPKTSYLAVLSAVAALKQILGPLKIGT
jgi:aspartate dehydrogenase